MFLRIFKHLLPRSRAWNITISKNLRKFFEGLANVMPGFKSFTDDAYSDIFPSTTTKLSDWENQFGLLNSSLTDQERRDRIAASWKAIPGQAPKVLQDTLQDFGFDAYVHDWWVPATNPPTARTPVGYPLVNKTYEGVYSNLSRVGNPATRAGAPGARFGSREATNFQLKQYQFPTDTTKWPMIVYVGAETFPDEAQIEASRKTEFEDLILKIFPSNTWIGVLALYVPDGGLVDIDDFSMANLGGTVEFFWSINIPGATYKLEKSTDYGSWTTLLTTDSLTTYSEAEGSVPTYYRLSYTFGSYQSPYSMTIDKVVWVATGGSAITSVNQEPSGGFTANCLATINFDGGGIVYMSNVPFSFITGIKNIRSDADTNASGTNNVRASYLSHSGGASDLSMFSPQNIQIQTTSTDFNVNRVSAPSPPYDTGDLGVRILSDQNETAYVFTLTALVFTVE